MKKTDLVLEVASYSRQHEQMTLCWNEQNILAVQVCHTDPFDAERNYDCAQQGELRNLPGAQGASSVVFCVADWRNGSSLFSGSGIAGGGIFKDGNVLFKGRFNEDRGTIKCSVELL